MQRAKRSASPPGAFLRLALGSNTDGRASVQTVLRGSKRDHERQGRDHENQGRDHERQGRDHERQGREHGGTMSAKAATMSAKDATMAGP